MGLFGNKAPRKMIPAELAELKEMQRIAAGERFKYGVFKNNTALLSVEGQRGQREARIQERRAEVCEQAVRDFVARKLIELGYPKGAKVDIVMDTGKITLLD